MQEVADSVSDCSSISRATDADWEDLAMADRPQSMMGNASVSFNMLVQCATSQIEHIRKSEVYQVYLKDNPTLSACGAVVLGILSLPALTFLSFIIVLCLLTFMGFLFIEGTLITFGVIVTAGILFFIGTFVASFGCCLYAIFYVLRTLKIVGNSAALADSTKKPE
ncbi:uncharacterized protein LOC142589526 isoform X1 [Dermacentor variabilis]|uniref:uncharacterized protein LOC142589526 isoform X1 n=2 Tax=Dermacentor variabilis TaxID=34621 RepID=UPI003F5C8254